MVQRACRALYHLAAEGGMPAEEKPEAGRESIMLARRALVINTQLHGVDAKEVGDVMGLLAT